MKKLFLLTLLVSFNKTIYGLEIFDTVMVGKNPFEIAVNSVLNKVYVSNNVTKDISIIEVNSKKVSSLYNSFPGTIKLNEKTNKAYIETSYGIMVLDGITDQTDTLIDVNSSYNLEINPINNFVYVGSNSDSCIAEINPLTYQVKYISTIYCPIDLKINKQTRTLYLIHGVYNKLSIIKLDNYNITSIPCGDYVDNICINESTNKIYVTDAINKSVFEINGIDNSSIIIQLNKNLGGLGNIEVNERENKIYVLNGDYLTVINGETRLTSNVYVGDNPWAINLNKNTNKVYITCFFEKKIVVVDGKTDKIIDSVVSPLLYEPTEIAINEKTNQIFVINRCGGGQGFIAIINDESSIQPNLSTNKITKFEKRGDFMRMAIQKEMIVSINCFNLQGKLVANNFNGKLEAGIHEIPLFTNKLSKGIYVYQTKYGGDLNCILYKKT
jgi:DNA-binding beta-propeller fold protein YncE